MVPENIFQQVENLINAGHHLSVRRNFMQGANQSSSGAEPADRNGGRSTSQIAKMVGISPRSVERVATVLRFAPPEVIVQARTGLISISRAYEEAVSVKKNGQIGPRGSQKTWVELLYSILETTISTGNFSRTWTSPDLELFGHIITSARRSDLLQESEFNLIFRALERRKPTLRGGS